MTLRGSLRPGLRTTELLVTQMVKNLPANAGDASSIPKSERSPGEGTGNPLQYSCLENPKDRGAWQATVHGSQSVGHNLGNKQQQIAQHSF